MSVTKLKEFLATKTYTGEPGREFESFFFFHEMVRNGQIDLCTKRFIIIFCLTAKSLETT